MSNMFGWIDHIAQFVLSLFPHLHVVNANEQGVKFSRGKNVRHLRPGLHWYWPLLTEEPTNVPVTRQTLSLASIKATTKDGERVAVTVALVFQVSDVIKAAVRTVDLDDALSDIGGSTVLSYLLSNDWSDILQDIAKDRMQESVLRTAADYMADYGITVLEVRCRDAAATYSISLIGDGFLTGAAGSSD